jgi:CDP-glycerol glycerophosphotransferase (TagB/SpsB family)
LAKDKNYEIEFKHENKTLKINFSRPCNFSRVVGYAKTKNYLSILKENKIVVEKKTAFKWIRQEIKTIARMLKKRESGFHVGVPFRIAYMLGYPFLRNKHIWFYMDRPEVSDDNGMHLFKYAVDKDPDIKKYFIIKKDTKDFGEMKKIGNVLGFKSIKHRYLGMFVENIVTSQPDNQIIYPFWGRYPYFAGLLKSNNVFLQHGIIKDDISSWLNKSNMNLAFFLTSAKMEYESIFKYPYHYDDNVVQLLGLPRYDNLENREDKKQIIIMPSWRRDLERKSKEYIKESEFFKRFNSLINNEKLMEKAREYGYEIIFRPHPKVYDFIELFDENDYVEIDYDRVKYQTLFNNGSVLITDYSSVAFDFAYLYKPVIYYQYGGDYHFDTENSFFDYETMGLGEIAKDEDRLVELLIEYMENDCEIKEKYYNRIKDFYLYTDKNNCKRVHEAIKRIPLKD